MKDSSSHGLKRLADRLPIEVGGRLATRGDAAVSPIDTEIAKEGSSHPPHGARAPPPLDEVCGSGRISWASAKLTTVMPIPRSAPEITSESQCS